MNNSDLTPEQEAHAQQLAKAVLKGLESDMGRE